MANNPLYPGFIDQKGKGGTGNPAYPGYFSGKPMYRAPKVMPLKPIEYNVDEVFQALDSLDYTPVRDIPKWIQERFADDFKQGLKATYNPADVDVTAIDDYDPDVLPGVASLSLTVDPREWADPGRLAESTAKSWIKSATGLKFGKQGWDVQGIDIDDYRSRIEQNIWRHAVGLVNEDETKPLSKTGHEAVAAVTDRTAGEYKSNLKITNSPYIDERSKADLYGVVAKDVYEFEGNRRSGLKRETSYDKFGFDAIKAGAKELNVKMNELDISTEAKGAIENFTNKATLLNDIREQQNSLDAPFGLKIKLKRTVANGQSFTDDEADYGKQGKLENLPEGIVSKGNTEQEIEALNASLQNPQVKERIAKEYRKKEYWVDTSKDKNYIGALSGSIKSIQNQVHVDNNGKISYVTSELYNNLEAARDAKGFAVIERDLEYSGIPVTKENIAAELRVREAAYEAAERAYKTERTPEYFRNKAIKSIEKTGLSRVEAEKQFQVQFESHIKNVENAYGKTLDILINAENEASKNLLVQVYTESGLSKNDAIRHIENVREAALKKGEIFGDARYKVQLSSIKGTLSKNATKEDLLQFYKSGLKLDKSDAEIKKILSESIGKSFDSITDADVSGFVTRRSQTLNKMDRLRVKDERVLLNKLDNIGGMKLAGGNTVQKSVERTLIRQTLETDLLGKGAIGVNRKTLVGDILETGELSGQVEYLGKTKKFANRMFHERNSFEVEEFFDAATQGKVWERYVWPEVTKRLTGYTPKELVQHQLKKVHYFGLAINEEYVTPKLESDKVFNALFKNKFNIKFSSNGQEFKMAVRGGAHLAGVGNLEGLSLLKVVGSGDKLFTEDQLKNILFGTDNLYKYGNRKELGFASAELNTKALNRFKEWASHELGLNYKVIIDKKGNKIIQIVGKEDQDKLWELYKALGKKNSKSLGWVGITRSYSGIMDRVGEVATKIQELIMKSPLFTKIIRPVFQASTIITEKIIQYLASLIAKLASKAGGAVSGGLLLILTPLIDKVLRPVVSFVLRKTFNYLSSFVGGVFRGNWGAMFAQVDKEVQNIIKFTISITFIVLAIFMGAIQFFTTVFAVNVSPIDASKIGSGYRDLFEIGSGYGLPGIEYERGSGETTSTVNCFEFKNSTDRVRVPDGTVYQYINWPGDNLSSFTQAIGALRVGTGTYVDRLCANGPINLYRASDTPGWCAHVISPDAIVFNSTCSYSTQNYVSYLFAHETGHIYANRRGFESAGVISLANAIGAEGTLPTYPGVCNYRANSVSEDFAETVGNSIVVNAWDCSNVLGYPTYDSFWAVFPRHKEYADIVLFRGTGGGDLEIE